MRKRQEIKFLLKAILLIWLSIVIGVSPICSAEIPRFFGIYIPDGKQYVEVPRYKMEKAEYNFRKRGIHGFDCNLKFTIPRDEFIVTHKNIFENEGFLVHQDPDWSNVRLYRVPHEGLYDYNEYEDYIITNNDFGCLTLGMVGSTKGLRPKVHPVEIPLRRAPMGENAYWYVPTKPLDSGFYLIDYNIDGQSFYGYNPIRVIEDGKELGEDVKTAFHDPTKRCEKAFLRLKLVEKHDKAEAYFWRAAIHSISGHPEHQDGEKAIKFAQKAINITSQRSDKEAYYKSLLVLSAAYARNNQFEEAIETINKIIRFQEKEELQELMNLYKQKKPFTLEKSAICAID